MDRLPTVNYRTNGSLAFPQQGPKGDTGPPGFNGVPGMRGQPTQALNDARTPELVTGAVEQEPITRTATRFHQVLSISR